MKHYLHCFICNKRSVHYYIASDTSGVSNCIDHFPHNKHKLPDYVIYKDIEGKNADGSPWRSWGVMSKNGVTQRMKDVVYSYREKNKPFPKSLKGN